MEQTVNSSWKIWIIAIALMIVIPATLQLGLEVFMPKDNWQQNHQNMHAFNEKYDQEHGGMKEFADTESKDSRTQRQEYLRQRYAAWQQTDDFKKYEYIICKRFMMGVFVGGCAAALLFALSGFVNVTVISAALIMSGLSVYMMNNLGSVCPIWYDINVNIWQILFALISLIIILRLAYRDSKEA